MNRNKTIIYSKMKTVSSMCINHKIIKKIKYIGVGFLNFEDVLFTASGNLVKDSTELLQVVFQFSYK